MHNHPLLVILGPTASGKTKLAVRLAHALNGEVISADSRQIFEGMDIGTGKDLNEYTLNGIEIPYHLINIRKAGEKYHVNAFKEDFYTVFEKLSVAQKLPVLCGGTGMYIHSILKNSPYTAIPVNSELRNYLSEQSIASLRERLATYPQDLTAHADQSTAKRIIRAIEIAAYVQQQPFIEKVNPPFKPLVIGLTGDLNKRTVRIMKRLEERLEEGLINEVEGLLNQGLNPDDLIFYGLEYKLVTEYLLNKHSLQELKERLYIAIRQFAKRQMTFYRKMEKDGVVINWLDADSGTDDLENRVIKLYQENFKI